MTTTEGEEFAARLRALKDRSGQSYGALAGRLHVSTSTLHRYCNGDAVPADYAPVDRLARLCGAGPGELVELHRAWIVADEARRRARARPQARPEPSVDGAPAPGEAAGPSAPGAAGPRRGGEAATARDGAQPGPAAGAGAPGAGGLSAGALGAGGSDAGGAEDGGVPGRGPSAGPARPRRRRLLWAAAAVAAVAVAVPAVVVGAGLGSAGGTEARPVRGAEASEAGGGAAAGPPVARSASPAPSVSAARPSAAGPAPAASHQDQAWHPHAAAGSAPAGAPSAPPLAFTVRPYTYETPCSQRFLVDKGPGDVPPPPEEQDAPGWVAAEGAVAAGSQYVALTVQGTGRETVVLNALHVRVVGARAPLGWSAYRMGDGCGGGVGSAEFSVDLDSGTPHAVAENGQRDFPFKVSESDPEVFYVSGLASAHDVSWYLELDWSSGTRHGTLRVDDKGRPFRTSGALGRPAYYYPVGGGAWQPEPKGN
ncbi:helix-turn-helix transcriptional regulator [Streptomyces tremellae]|uniref:helix-turn-helix domain-containing protein n=1 Tax=Streptomyces tremellae TaxID=1124239 RepID=UPI0031F02BC9